VIALLWLAGAVAFAAAAYAVGWPAWREYRQRETRDLNAERYLAWRGRASRAPSGTLSEGMTLAERRRLYAASALALASVACVVAFLAAT
jgi:hypothetical protein